MGKVKLKVSDIDNWDENWTLSFIEEGFEIGDYKLVK